MNKILFWSLLLLPTLLFATDMGGIFFVILWVVLGYQSVYSVLTGLLIHLFIKKKFYSLFPKVLVYIFLILGIITGGALLIMTIGLCFEPAFWVDAYFFSLSLQVLSILTGWFQISRGRIYLKEAKPWNSSFIPGSTFSRISKRVTRLCQLF